MSDKDWYAILGLPPLADADAVKKAFRQMSLKHHPDKGGDVDKFHELQQASQFLLDPVEKKKYDAKITQVTMKEKQSKERQAKMSEERKRMADELLRREEQTNRKKPKHVMEDLKAKARQHMEEMQEKREQAARERAELLGQSLKKGDIKQRTIRVSWDNKKESHSDQTLVNAFRQYGEIEVVKMKNNSARLVFSEAASAVTARIEGHNVSKWKDVTLVGHVVHQYQEPKVSTGYGGSRQTYPAADSESTVQLSLHPISLAELAPFEEKVLAHLKRLAQGI
ncbi:hypothetical protein Ae201684P_006647 [Aphanomyces euteiches]|nr:hypothetical protein Ae201684P_006647 [Aphanomyces euteiches]